MIVCDSSERVFLRLHNEFHAFFKDDLKDSQLSSLIRVVVGLGENHRIVSIYESDQVHTPRVQQHVVPRSKSRIVSNKDCVALW
jgi:hypothetical protein